MPSSAPSTPIDVFVVHTQMEWHIARSLVDLLVAHGFTVGSSRHVERPGVVAGATPGDARATIVIWPLDRGLCDMLEMEARAAAQRGALVEIYAGRVRPSETYAGSRPVDFTGWDYTRPGMKWETLLHRLRPLCGPPRKRPVDVVAMTQKVVLFGTLAITMTAIIAALGQVARDGTKVVARDPMLTAPRAAPIVSPEEAPAPVHPGVVVEAGGPGDYKRDLGDIDQGIDVAKLPPAEAPEEEATAIAVKRAPQGPEQ
jgi:hypothetical protein